MARLITPIATLSYPHLHTAQAPMAPGGEAKYAATLVFDAAAQATPEFKAIQAEVLRSAEEFFKGGYTHLGKKITVAKAFELKLLKYPIRDDAEAKGYPEGSVYLSARSTDQPQMVRGDKSVIPQDQIRDVLYPGSKVRVSLAVFTYDKGVNKGTSFALGNVQKAGEGDRLDSRRSADQDFDALDAAPISQEDIDALTR